MKSRLIVIALAACIITIGLVNPLFAGGQKDQAYPNRTIEIVVPSGAGGGQDTMVRFMQPLLEKELGVSIRVTNVSGGAHVKGIIYTHSAPADGYTVHCESPSGIIADIFKKMEFKFTEEFVPVALIQKDNGVIWTGTKGRFKDIKEVIDFAKKNPGKVTVAIASPGGVDDAGVGTFASLAGIEIALVPTESGGERMASVIAGHVDLMYEEVSAVGDMVAGGMIKPILLFSEKRINTPEFKDVPATSELGFDGMSGLGTWRGFAVKKGTPQEAIDRLAKAFKKVYDSPEYQKWAEDNVLHLNPGWLGPKDFGKLWEENLDSYTKVFQKLGRL